MIEIEKLDVNNSSDYLDFFDHRAFSDENPNGPCYCTSPNMCPSIEKKMVSEFSNGVKETLRKYAVKMLDNQEISGYLAYDGDLSIGWCNCANLNSYSQFIPEVAKENKLERTISVVCFEIAPNYRKQGIATAFLSRICSDAKKEGYNYVEGYVKRRVNQTEFDYTGPQRLYLKAGFSEVLSDDKYIVMRKKL